MDTAVYAISQKDTFSILAFCSFAKQPVTDTKTASALLDRLIGPKLTLSIPTSHAGPISIPASDLLLDEVSIDGNALAANPFIYQIAASATQKPGDGTPKGVTVLSNPTTVTLATDGKLTVTPANLPGPPLPMYAILEGHPAQSGSLFTLSPAMVFDFTDVLAAKTAYAVVLVGQGIPTLVGTIMTP